MKIPFTLRKIKTPEPAIALLLTSEDSGQLLRLCAAVAADPSSPTEPVVYHVAGGYLLYLPQPTQCIYPGALRLRERAPHLLLPVDAELWPALFDDEARAMAGPAHRGLVFLPGERVLAFEPNHRIPLAGLLQAPTVGTGSWQPLPEVPQLADRLTSVVLDRPSPGVEEILSPGGEGIAVEELDTPRDGVVPRATAGMKEGVGNLLAWLGQKLGWKQLAQAGANMAQSAREFFQRGQQGFAGTSGKRCCVSCYASFKPATWMRALRRALPLGESGGRGSQLDPGAELPTHQLRYSLNDLRGSSRGGIWQGGG